MGASPKPNTNLTGFRALKPVGSGGVWDSFSGWSERLNRDVNVTLIHADAVKEESVRKRLRDIGNVVTSLQHPMLQRCLMIEPRADGSWTVLNEPVEGPTLAQHLSENGALSLDDAVQLTVLLCEAVDAAHQRGAVHGGLSPQYVTLSGGLHAFEPKVTGFAQGALGLATRNGFSAPELATRRDPSPLADLYSLGALLYACLTGAPPVDADLAKCDPLPPGTEHLVPVLQKVMNREFTRRYFSASELARALTKANGTLVPLGQSVTATQPLDDPSDTVKPDMTLGPYQLVTLLGEGSMGQVYLARHKALGRQVAIKILRPEQYRRGDLIQRFFQEARTVNQINHEHIVEIFDFVQEPGPDGPSAVYCVMELLQGQSLTNLVESGPIALKRAVHITRQLCDALFAAHKVGVVHRDVKPDNIFLIERAGQQDYVKVLDFGVAKLTHAQADTPLISTMDGAIIGTPMCMAPEQAAGQAVDHRADIYATGVILYLMLTGKLPFDAKNFASLAVQLITQPPPPLPDRTTHGDTIDPTLKALVLKCLEKDPAKRPSTMRELGDALAPFLIEPEPRPSAPTVMERSSSGASPVPASGGSAFKWVALVSVLLAVAGTAAVYVYKVDEAPPVTLQIPVPVPVAQDPPKPPVEPPKPPPVEPPAQVDPPPVEPPQPPPPVQPPKPPPPVKPVKLTQAMIEETVKKVNPDVRRCFDRHQTQLKDAEGHVDIVITIDLPGNVSAAELATPGYAGTPLEACLLKEAKRMRFPKHFGPAPKIKVPFTYRRG